MLEEIAICLTALYLRGLERPVNLSRRRWVRVVSCLRSADCAMPQVPAALRVEGFWEEALLLEGQSVVDEARQLLDGGFVLTAMHPAYPKRWMERLTQAAPPALWISGVLPERPFLGIVGSRQVEPVVREFAWRVGAEATRLGFAVVSGGAAGCDHAGAGGAVDAGGDAIEVLPYGIELYQRQDRCALSACAPNEEFSTASAMERNGLIYASAEQTVIAHARFKEGGTWIGAVDALRRRLCPLLVREDDGPASRALTALGAKSVASADDLEAALSQTPVQKGLFGIG